MFEVQKQRREYMRWLIVLALNNSRPYSAGEGLILSVAQAEYQDATPHEIRRELGYLEGRKLVDIIRDPAGPWRADLTHYGVDLAEYAIDCQPGISRPAKYW